MSWYSPIYSRVRNYQQKNPIIGWLLARALNLLLIVQFIGHIYSIYVFIFHICGNFIDSAIQATIYIGIYITFSLLAIWSLLTTVLWPVKRVPDQWSPRNEQIEELKKITPKVGNRYVVDKSSREQLNQQHAILTDMVRECGIVQAECDQAGRAKFCYQCNHLKPDRTHHCNSCGFCVVRFDHHCPWINHCVNYYNYKYFILYLFYGLCVIIFFLIAAIETLIRFFIRQDWEHDWLSLLLILSVTLPFSIFGYYPLGELMYYHYGLIAINETTWDYNMGKMENFRQVFGWGLWLFPLPTRIEDGMHFLIRYMDAKNKLRYKRIEKTSIPLKSTELPVDETQKDDSDIIKTAALHVKVHTSIPPIIPFSSKSDGSKAAV